MPPLIECVPNFSEGRDPEIIRRISEALGSVEGAKLLHVDPGKATNRTVMTIAGTPEAVSEAAFRAIKVAGELIDMRGHHGEHPRMGATDVCPLVPISGITMEETARHARALGERVGRELGLPVYAYEAAQPNAARKHLAVIREGEYEGLERKMQDPAWKPDFGPATFDAQRGATVIGARDFLVAFNVNLNTTSTRRANAIAFDVREAGRPKREGDPLTGKEVKDAAGNVVMIPGTLKGVKAIGWFIQEYGVAQVSMNLVDLNKTSVHAAFDEVCRAAEARGVRVTGSELVGLVPLGALLDAGKHYLKKQQRSAGIAESEILRLAVKSLGLDELGPFTPEERIIEYRLRDTGLARLVGMTVRAFTDETAAESPAPGGGSVAALNGALGAALGTMVANLSSHKRGWDARWEEFSAWAEQGQAIKDDLLRLVDADTAAFDQVMAALALPKGTEAEKAARSVALAAANLGALKIPYEVMQKSFAAFELLRAMANEGNPSSVSDAGVGAICIRTAIRGAHLNVRINAGGIKDKASIEAILQDAARIEAAALKQEEEILRIVESKLK